MNVLAAIAITSATVLFMEAFANLSHRYIMHGWGWGWHESHHVDHDDAFEKNDLYAAVFALPSIGLIWLGSTYDSLILWVGVGMAVYGLLYFIVHDGLVHQRWPFRHVPRNPYLKRLVQAHRLHHAVRTKKGCVSFGFLYTPTVAALKAKLRELHGGPLGDSERSVQERAASGGRPQP